MRIRLAIASLASCFFISVSIARAQAPAAKPAESPAAKPAAAKLFLAPFANGYEKPVQIATAPNGDMYVVEQTGRVRLLDPDETRRPAIVDIREDVVVSEEGGLLGFAFHPKFGENRLTYAHYIGKSREIENRISEFDIPTSGAASINEERKLMRILQKEVVHLGGQILFGPDGYLYIGLGDGNSGNDALNRGQNYKDQFGSILRIGVEAEESTRQEYLAPVSNPFVVTNLGHRDVYAVGLRNPRTFSFDSATKDLWVGDSGTGVEQEIDLVKPGGNYGWNVFDGEGCMRMKFECMNQKYIPPVRSYLKGEGTAVVVGFVYRGKALPPEYQGLLFYSDRITGRVSGMRSADGKLESNSVLLETGKDVSAFGQAANGELYLADYGTGDIFKISVVAQNH